MLLCLPEDTERMETTGGPQLHGSAVVPSLHGVLRGHGEWGPCACVCARVCVCVKPMFPSERP